MDQNHHHGSMSVMDLCISTRTSSISSGKSNIRNIHFIKLFNHNSQARTGTQTYVFKFTL